MAEQSTKCQLLAAVLEAWRRKKEILRGHVAATEQSGNCQMHLPDSFHEAEIDLITAKQTAKRGGCSMQEIAEAETTAEMEF
jgi:hypothetical protein